MMEYSFGLAAILDVARETASREFQKEEWLSGRPSSSSLIELYCNLFDDYQAETFMETYSNLFTASQLNAWKDFKESLDRFEKKFPKLTDERVVYYDPDWQLVREAAGRFVKSFTAREGDTLL